MAIERDYTIEWAESNLAIRAAGRTPLGLPAVRRRYPLLLAAPNRFPSFLIRRPSSLGLPFVPKLLAFGQGQLHFHFAVLEVHADWDQRQSLLLGFTDQLADFFFVHQQLTGAQRGVVMDVAVLVGADVGVEQPEFAVLDQAVGVFEVGEAAADRFGLGPS